MSWSFQVIGKPAAVASNARAYKEKHPCHEPEESLRKAALDLVAAVAEAQGAATFVRVTACGSMWKEGDAVRTNSIEIKVEPLHGVLVE